MKTENGPKYIYQKDEDKEKSKKLDREKKRKGVVKDLIDLYSPFLPECLVTKHFIPSKYYKNNSRSEPEEE